MRAHLSVMSGTKWNTLKKTNTLGAGAGDRPSLVNDQVYTL